MSGFWRGDNAARAAELQEMALMRVERISRKRWDLLLVTLEDPSNKRSAIIIRREGYPKFVHRFEKAKQAQKFVYNFYNDLIYNSECHY